MKTKLRFCTQTAMVALLIGADAAAAKAIAAASPDTIETVVVTAEKRSEPLQKTPIAVTALSASDLAVHHVQTVADLTHLVPSFQATTQGDHGVITMTLRGVGNDSAKTEYADPEVALFVDGVYTPRAESASALLLDLDSVEVLRGPQGTLWGRNSTVGVVNMVTAKPNFDGMSGNLQVGVGDYARLGVRGAINIPVTDDWAVRVAFAQEQHDGYVSYQNPNGQIPSIAVQRADYLLAGGVPAAFQAINPNLYIQNGTRYSAQNQGAVRVSSLWTPTSDITWDVSFEYFRDRGTPDANLMQVPRPGQKFWSTLADTAPYLHRDSYSVRSRLDWNLDDYLELSYIAGASWFSGSSDFDQDGGVHVPTYFSDPAAADQEDRTNSSKYSTYSHELELKSQGSHELDWILGLYYGAEDNSIRFDIPILNGTQQGTIAWQGSFIQPKETVQTEAAFGQATWNVTDNFHLTGGLRYTDDHRGNIGGTNNAWSYNAACPQVPLDPGTNPLSPSENPSCFNTYQQNTGHYHSSKLTWLGRANWNVTDDFLLYASAATGYKSGGLQDGGLTYGPETLYNFEVGSKNTLFGGRATLNNAAFFEDFHHYQFSSPVNLITPACAPNPSTCNHALATSNAASATIFGFESEIDALLTDDDKVHAGVSVLHGKIGHLFAGSNDYNNLVANLGPGGALVNGPPCPILAACVSVTGHTLAHTPNFSVTLGYEHDFHLWNGATLEARATPHFETSSWLSIFNDGPGDRQSAYTRTDVSLTYVFPNKPWSVEVYAQNIEDGRVKTNALATSDNVYSSQYMAPMTFGANLSIGF